MAGLSWALITGEYPPKIGGVSDNSHQIARGLARAGEEVHVFTPFFPGAPPADPGVLVHALPGPYGLRALIRLDSELGRLARPPRVLVAYVPHGFGWRAMNLPLCLWLRWRCRGPVWPIFHEIAFPVARHQPLKHNLLGVVHRVMATQVARGAQRIFISTPQWEAVLRRITRVEGEMTFLPVPSNIPVHVPADRVAALRSKLAPAQGAVVIGHFGMYRQSIGSMVAEAFVPLLSAAPDRVGLLIGLGAREFSETLIRRHPQLASRLRAPGELPPEEIAAHLAACDLLVQPFDDGVCVRRTTLMAGMALGLPIVTNAGPATEPFWQDSGAVAVARGSWPQEAVRLVDQLLAEPAGRRRLGERARSLYEEQFSIERTIQTLRSASA